MSTELSIPNILIIARICEYLNAVKTAVHDALKGGDISQDRANLIYMERMAVQNRYNLNPSDPTLPGTANYLFSILRYQSDGMTIKNRVAAGVAVVTGPSNQSVNVGQLATFAITVTSATPYVISWYRNGALIPGQTGLSYTLVNAQLSDTGTQFSAIVTNASGSVSSNVAVLTVTAVITGYLYNTSTDPGPTLLSSSDPFTYQTNFPITHNNPIDVPISVAAGSNQFLVVKVPATESRKTTWFSTTLNNGVIPPPADFVFATPVTFGGFTYYYTKQLISLDPTVPLVLS